ncbi:porin [uncultured Endozoicomonas sp.]|uniref:porin n=1 Tax=uncultured Endozoicomonas sp. TaxID=432652 RepID=UPI002621FD5A|nr:porin [uncultured Endozoicomonas sp.]
MQKTLIAAALTSLIANQAMAITLHDDGTNKATLGGYLDLRYTDQDDGKHEGDSSRINFGFESILSDDLTAFAMAEWGIDTGSSGDTRDVNGNEGDLMWQRLGYVGVESEQWGSLAFGKQWSSYSQVAGWTDMFATVGGDASGFYGKDAEVLGTSRADDALQYNGSFGGLSFSAQYQMGDRDVVDLDRDYTNRDSAYGFAASYDLPMGLSFGVAYNEAKLDDLTENTVSDQSKKAKSAIVGAKYEADKLYAALTYAELKDRNAHDYLGQVDKAEGYELYVSYQFQDNLKIETGYNQLKDKGSAAGEGEVEYYPVGLVYTTGPLQLSGTYVFENSTDMDGDDVDDRAVLQARYYF